MYKEVFWQELLCCSVPPAELNNLSVGKSLGGAPRHAFMVAAWHNSLTARCHWWRENGAVWKCLTTFCWKKLFPTEVYAEEEKSFPVGFSSSEIGRSGDVGRCWPLGHSLVTPTAGWHFNTVAAYGSDSWHPMKFQVFCGRKTLQHFKNVMWAVRCGGFSCGAE